MHFDNNKIGQSKENHATYNKAEADARKIFKAPVFTVLVNIVYVLESKKQFNDPVSSSWFIQDPKYKIKFVFEEN